MLNPAWQPAHRDNAALRQLRGRFLPEAASEEVEPARTLQVPVIVTGAHDTADTGYLIQALNRQLNLSRGETDDTGRWRVDALQPSGPASTWELPFVLVIAQADLAALCEAYRRVKQVARARPATFGVLIQGARDLHGARRHYRRLAMATVRFLDLALLNLGTVPVRNQAFGTALDRLAQAIRDGAYSHGRPLSPTGPDS